MSTTTLEPDFLRAVVLVTGFKGNAMRSCQAALIFLGLRQPSFTAAQIPAELTNGSKHLAGCAAGSLIAIGLLEVTGRVKSPNPNAKGRKLDLLAIPMAKLGAARVWLERNGFPQGVETEAEQKELFEGAFQS